MKSGSSLKQTLSMIVASSWLLTACGAGVGAGGVSVDGSGNIQNLSSSSEFTNLPTNTGSGQPSTEVTNSNEIAKSLAPPATETQAFSTVNAAHSTALKSAVSVAGLTASTGFQQLTPGGVQQSQAVPSGSPYGGVAPAPVVTIDPTVTPPTGVENPDNLPVLPSSVSKKGGIAAKLIGLITPFKPFLAQLPAAHRALIKADCQQHLSALSSLNLTNLSAETQSLVQANLLVITEVCSAI